MPTITPLTILVTNDGMGQAEPVLRHKLAKSYFTLLTDVKPLPGVIAFYTEGVRLVCSGSPVLDELKTLESKGVRLVICKTCLDHFGLRDAVEVGIVGGMTDILEAQLQADKVVTI
ncbi:MAG: sulfurtransferase-like selenium metabolism protein YedF [Chloroflexi bacterium]|nr:sulfurtransferase-like selenium metabolism protein YedF [Chloroflexota bacterium]